METAPGERWPSKPERRPGPHGRFAFHAVAVGTLAVDGLFGLLVWFGLTVTTPPDGTVRGVTATCLVASWVGLVAAHVWLWRRRRWLLALTPVVMFLSYAAFAGVMTAQTPHLDALRAMPEASLVYPGSRLLDSHGSEGAQFPMVVPATLAFTYRLDPSSGRDDVLSWYDARLNEYGWTRRSAAVSEWRKGCRLLLVDVGYDATRGESSYEMDIYDYWDHSARPSDCLPADPAQKAPTPRTARRSQELNVGRAFTNTQWDRREAGEIVEWP